ncbi:leucine-rich repeat-containing protein 57 [Bacillus rossius redtenbacheri]|uniref:leucine-rich repeat-containing protein 57 n=1 Tax=Bacillus rossius redtenbacheri TaxID=93214 RepID=UPI002FDE944F
MGNSGLKQHLETAKKTGVLKISQGKLTEFPSNFKQLEPLLRTLDISENKFVTLPSDINSFKLLKHLNVSQNRLISLPESLGHLSKLESLSACSNKITYIPQTLSQLVHLKQVYLSDNLISDFPVVFCGLKHLDVLDVSRNKISKIPDRVCELQVTELNLNQNQIASVSDKIADCPRLKTLRLEENCLQLSAIHSRILTDSKISILALDGNLFDKKHLADVEGYDKYMERYTAVKKKLF